MPGDILLQAISRLDQAVVKAEAGCESFFLRQDAVQKRRDESISVAIAEIDALVGALRSSAEPGEPQDG